MTEPDWIAIMKPGEEFYTWYDRSTVPVADEFAEREKQSLPGYHQINYQATGQFLLGDDGRVAEIWEPIT